MDKNIIKKNSDWLNTIWKKTEDKLSVTAVRSRNKIPYTAIKGKHDNRFETAPTSWTNGFWGGIMWLMYKETGNEEFKKTALYQEKLLDNAFKNFKLLHHDVGFMWHLVAGANYRITGDEAAANRNLFAAATLASRYNVDGKYIRAWNGWFDEDVTGWSIIDSLMNLPILYWASEEIGDIRFKRIAMHHMDMALNDHIRPDGSTYHIVEHDTETGEFIKSHTGQGYSEASCWSRGLAWAIYGSILSYVHTGKQEYLDACKKTANYFITHCAIYDYRAPIDFKAPTDILNFDATASLCAACGILELSKYVTPSEDMVYTDAAIKLLRSADKYYANYSTDIDYLIGMGSERWPHNEESAKTVNIPIIYGDFFYIEALLKLKGSDFLIW